MRAHSAVTARELEAGAFSLGPADFALAVRLSETAQLVAKNERRRELINRYKLACKRSGSWSAEANKIWRELRAETNRELGA